jgi:putative SOS response-associated peptidase YedK
MSSLYRLDALADQIGHIFATNAGDDPWAGGYVAPGGFAPVIIRDRQNARRMVPRQWGVPPPGNAGQDGATIRPVTAVRNLTSPFWIGTLRHTEFRCLVPVTRFQFWGPESMRNAAGKRARCWFSVPSEPIFAFAGIWRDSEVPSFAILTTEPNSLVAQVHPAAMPVILAPEDHDRWLSESWPGAGTMIDAFPAQLLLMEIV